MMSDLKHKKKVEKLESPRGHLDSKNLEDTSYKQMLKEVGLLSSEKRNF